MHILARSKCLSFASQIVKARKKNNKTGHWEVQWEGVNMPHILRREKFPRKHISLRISNAIIMPLNSKQAVDRRPIDQSSI